jgi:hypothetical protein
LGTLEGTEEGARLMAKLSEINIKDVRHLIKRLIKGGYDKKMPIRPSEQEILTSFETSLLIASHLANIRGEIHSVQEQVQTETTFLQDAVMDICVMIQPILTVQDIVEGSLSEEFQEQFRSLKTYQLEHDDMDEVNQAIDSDEEAKLFEELDALMDAQERALAFRGNAHQLMAQAFKKVSRRVVELETAYDLVDP